MDAFALPVEGTETRVNVNGNNLYRKFRFEMANLLISPSKTFRLKQKDTNTWCSTMILSNKWEDLKMSLAGTSKKTPKLKVRILVMDVGYQ